jgi:UDP-N-acetylmuramoyl-L-alanyl-D-glutamate--2,6-diaminopimelate ligase
MRLNRLLTEAGLPPAAGDAEVTSLSYDSRRCSPGSLFVAIAGFHTDGHQHAAGAVRNGAVAVVAERALGDLGVPVIIVDNSRAALASLARVVHGDPSRALTVAGVTGTDGKTTTTTMLWAAWRAAGRAAGALTTVDWRCGDEVVPNKSRQTTLEAPELQQQLAAMREKGCTHVALETSSHALELHRVDGVAYRLAVYTRITSEHLELHGSRERYFAAKRRLLEMAGEHRDGVAVLDATDDFAYTRLRAVPVATRISYSTDPAVAADCVATSIRSVAGGVDLVASTPWGTAPLRLRLAGSFNAGNALAAIAAACASGATLEQAIAGVSALERVTGRMEVVDEGQPFTAVVDYAHTAQSLERVLRELRSATRGRLIVVFGSAGERDREKRPAMGAVAGRLADLAVVTDEDPRGEDREAILEEIAAGALAEGARRGETLLLIPDRPEAIDAAVSAARPGDTVLFAGKGHEGSIIGAEGAVPWDERAEVERALRRARRGGGPAHPG